MPSGKPSHGHHYKANRYIEDCHVASMLLTHPLLCLQEFSNSSQPACLLGFSDHSHRWGYLRSWLHQSRQAHITRQLHRSQSSWHFRKQLLLYTHRGQAGGEPPRHLHFLVSPENLETLASPLEPSAWKGTESSPKLAGTAPKRR